MYYKLNVDGSCCHTQCNYGIGGVIRDHQRNWIIGFAGGVQQGSPTQIELLALLKGLQIAAKQNQLPLIIETDAQNVLGMLNSPALNCINIVTDCRSLLQQLDRASVQVIYREQNGVADTLAKYGAMHVQEQCLLFESPPLFAQSYYHQDHQGILHLRKTRQSSSSSYVNSTVCTKQPTLVASALISSFATPVGGNLSSKDPFVRMMPCRHPPL
ncbi:PREDICTED: uncharacterized protein LOC109217762 [Nicotiana attenuata]|uniref:uncharacterized protein LOC109217762 n=1 Tax=Nicotiana attenuata TaxID=49451 RepID=UPI00090588B4|nr:PREDICTED: uncharacterized protein LOC109217762 [Nicotiana attenuata]